MINDKLLNIQYGSGSLSFYKKDWLLPAAETTDMGFNFPLTAEHAERYTRIIEEGAAVRRHYDFLIWLQGELQHYLPHEIMLAAWGDFKSDHIHYDIASALLGVRTAHSNMETLSPLLQGLFSRWTTLGKTPYILTGEESVFLLEEHGLPCPLGAALRGMRSVLVHGISDKRGQHDGIYVVFSSRRKPNISVINAIKILLPYIDAAMGQIEPAISNPRAASPLPSAKYNELGVQEMEILNWVKAGKTNSEIAGITGISMVALKNHFRNIFKKLHEREVNAFRD
ncbi:MAG TPA: XrtB/PEP-CTERM-associated transcriptional regulator EpsA [Nitrosospira sp.]|jgi:transcriptional regulator EpsA|nr:XrtB/PEP-CTERM-associated transcriptional regulator EpsA [Nitrosospira sp.]